MFWGLVLFFFLIISVNFPKVESVLTVTGKCLLTDEIFLLLFFLFSPPHHQGGGVSKHLVGAWVLAKGNPPKGHLPFIIINQLHVTFLGKKKEKRKKDSECSMLL